jgi:diaminopimelate epimerase
MTLACGTGTCASLAACVVNGRTDMKATAHLPGGDMLVEWNKDGNIYMTGPAVTVFKGEYKL